MQDDDPELLRYLVELQDRLAEDEMYETVLGEIEKDQLDAVAQARAFEEACGNAEKARSLYIKHRMRRMKDLSVAEALRQKQEEMEKQRQREEMERQRQAREKPFSLEEYEEHLRQHEQRKRKLREM